MRSILHYSSFASLILLASACTSESHSDTSATGHATYRDAETDHDGNAKQTSSPPPQNAFVEIVVEGSADLPELSPECSVDGLSGAFVGAFDGNADIGPDGAFVALLSSTEAQFTTPSGCDLPELDIALVNEVVVRATIEATTTNCDSYCSAKARSSAEAECGADAGAASCRAQQEASYEASCTTSCVETAHTIVAETSLSAQAVAELNARNLSGGALGELRVDLTFDHLETQSGDTVAEN